MNSVLFCSDLHLGHDTAATLRGFKSIAEHDHTIITMLSMQCDKRTVLWVLGDVAMKMENLQLLAAVPGRKILVRGNHDEFPIAHYQAAGFEQIHGIIKYKHMWVTHCPIHPQEMYRADANLHGHIHFTASTQQPPFPYINMNWDFWQRAVSLDEIKGIVAKKYVVYPFHDDKVVHTEVCF